MCLQNTAEEHRENVKERVLLHACSFNQYIYRAAGLDALVVQLTTSRGRTAAAKCIQTRLALPREVRLQEQSWQEHRAFVSEAQSGTGWRHVVDDETWLGRLMLAPAILYIVLLIGVRVLFTDTMFAQWLLNTALVGVLVVGITLLLAVPAGYSLARLTGHLGEQLGIAIFLTYLVPPTILFIPLSRVIATLKLQDSLWSLVLVYPSFTVPFCPWLLMGFFKAIPRDLEEAAMLDGHSRLGAFDQSGCSRLCSGDFNCGDFHLHAGDAGVCVRSDVYHGCVALYRERGGPHLSRTRRCLSLGFADGRLLHRQCAYCHPVQFFPGSVYHWLYSGSN